MKITINKDAEKILKRVKKKMHCSDSTAIILLAEILRMGMELNRKYKELVK